jgi:hypothetical protein
MKIPERIFFPAMSGSRNRIRHPKPWFDSAPGHQTQIMPCFVRGIFFWSGVKWPMLYLILRFFSSLPLAAIQMAGACIGLLIYLCSPRYRTRLYKNHQSAANYCGFKFTPWRGGSKQASTKKTNLI